MLEKQNIHSSKSETLHFPNVGTMMKISFGLILFTMISTVLVYAETSDGAVVTIIENINGLLVPICKRSKTRDLDASVCPIKINCGFITTIKMARENVR